MRSTTVWVLAVLTVNAGCQSEERTEVIVDLRTDLAPGIEFSAVRTELTSRRGETRNASLPAFRSEDYLAARRVAELGGVARGNATLRVTLADDSGAPVLVRESVVRLDGRVAVLVVLTRDCRGVRCDDPGRPLCVAGQCVPAECGIQSLLECGEAECDTDAACDPPAAACARATCAEGACLSMETPGACGMSEWCQPETGCMPVPDAVPPDAGPPGDGGTDDAGSGDGGTSDAGAVDAGAADAGPDPRCMWSGTQWSCNCPMETSCDFVCDPTATSCVAECGTVSTCSLDCGAVRSCTINCSFGAMCDLRCPPGCTPRMTCVGVCVYECVGC